MASAKINRIRRVTPIVVFLLIIFVPVPTAFAHAEILSSEPSANAVLATAPRQVRLWFTEPIAPQFSAVQLINAQGQSINPIKIDTAATQEDMLVIALPELAPGVYNLAWKTFSGDDGHVTQGQLVFGVGVGADKATFALDTPTALPWAEALLRWLTYGTQISLIGALAIVLLLFDPALRITDAQSRASELIAVARTRLWLWIVFLALAALCVGVAVLGWQAVTSPLAPTAAEPGSDGVILLTLWQLLRQTRWGSWWLVRQTILLVLLVVTYQMANGLITPDPAPQNEPATAPSKKSAAGKNQRRPIVNTSPSTTQRSQPPVAVRLQVLLLTGLVLALAVSQVAAGHAAALTSHTALAIGAGALHLLAAGVWIGGLLALSIGFLPLMDKLKDDAAGAAQLIQIGWRPFSRLALLSVGLVVATGLYSTGREVASVDAALVTRYGWMLLSKLGLVLGVGLLGLINAVLIHPTLVPPLARRLGRLLGGPPLPPTRLPMLLLAEVTLGLLVLLMTSFLTSSAPARGTQFAPAPVATSSVLRQAVDNLIVTLAVQPNQPGANRVIIQVNGVSSAAPNEIMRVITRFTYLGQEIGTVATDASATSDGRYEVNGSQLSIAGPWQMQVVVRRKGLEDSIANFDWRIAAPVQPLLLSNQPIQKPLTLAAVTLLLLACTSGVALWRRHPVSTLTLQQPQPADLSGSST